MEYKKEFKVDGCIHRCPLFKLEWGSKMICTHPYFDNTLDNSNVISNDVGYSFPDFCPLQKETETIMIKKYKIVVK
jgi:hypothetical protein